MKVFDDDRDAAIERRLRSWGPVVASPGHRTRVLAAVDDVLGAHPVAAVVRAEGLGGTAALALIGSAAAIAPLVVGSWLAGLAAVVGGAGMFQPPRPALVERARSVGVELPPAALAMARRPAAHGIATTRAAGAGEDRVTVSLRGAADEWWRMRHALEREL